MLIAVERVQILVLPGHGELIALDTVLGKMAVSRTAKIPQDSHETPSSINTFKTLRAKGKAKALFCPKPPPPPFQKDIGRFLLRPFLLQVEARCRRR